VLADSVLETLRRQVEFFERASTYDGRSRERVIALGQAEELYSRLYPHHYRAMQTIRVASQLERLTASSDDHIGRCESRLLSLLMDLILEALRAGDLKLHGSQRPSELVFALWSLAFGARALMDTGVATRELGIQDGAKVARDATDLLLDALHWAPLSSQWDYSQTRQRVREVLFAGECDPENKINKIVEP
jgi:hypothetical protein